MSFRGQSSASIIVTISVNICNYIPNCPRRGNIKEIVLIPETRAKQFLVPMCHRRQLGHSRGTLKKTRLPGKCNTKRVLLLEKWPNDCREARDADLQYSGLSQHD